MVGKEHRKLLRDIRNYIEQLNESKIGHGDFFIESSYKDTNNQTCPCYDISKKGCEFIAHKLTGVKSEDHYQKIPNVFCNVPKTTKTGHCQNDSFAPFSKTTRIGKVCAPKTKRIRKEGV